MPRGENKCAACGEFAGRGHRCPGPAYEIITPENRPDGQPIEDGVDREMVEDRVARAEAALAAAQREYAEALASTGQTPVGSRMVINSQGNREWLNERGELHRLDGPAYEKDDYEGWYRNGELHREDGPARVWKDGSGMEEWYRNGVLHRDGGPAVIDEEGSKRWYRNGKLHRTDGPAIEYADGMGGYEYFQNGKLHRTDGPASVYTDYRGNQVSEWYVNGERVDPIPQDDPEAVTAAEQAVWNINQSNVSAVTNLIRDGYFRDLNDDDWDYLTQYAADKGYPISDRPTGRDEYTSAMDRFIGTAAHRVSTDSFDFASAMTDGRISMQNALDNMTEPPTTTAVSILKALSNSEKSPHWVVQAGREARGA